MAETIESIVNEAEEQTDHKIQKLQVDEGNEFYNKHAKELLDKKRIKMFSTKSLTKAQMVRVLN